VARQARMTVPNPLYPFKILSSMRLLRPALVRRVFVRRILDIYLWEGGREGDEVISGICLD
jgi:hypothetical protein